jgi:hypothetical protein
MSKVLLDRMPAPSPLEHRPAARGRSPQRSRVEAGVLGLVIGGILVFAAGFAVLFPESIRSPAFWPSYEDPAGVFEMSYPRGWTVQESASGAIFRAGGEDLMVVAIVRLEAKGAGVEELASQRMTELADLGATEAALEEWPAVNGRPTVAIRELASGDATVTTRVFVDVGRGTYLTISATAPAGAYEADLFDRILGTLKLIGPDVAAIDDRVSESRS